MIMSFVSRHEITRFLENKSGDEVKIDRGPRQEILHKKGSSCITKNDPVVYE